MMTLYRDNAASVQPPPAVGGNILIKVIMLYVTSFAIVRLSVFARQNPDMSRSCARGRPGMTHECRLLLKIVTSRGVSANLSVADSSYSPRTQATISACTTTIQRALLACRGARNGSSRPCRRAHRRNRRPSNLVFSMRFFAHELATTKLDHAMSGTRIRLRRCS